MPAVIIPPFPDNVPTHPLLIIDYELLKARDKNEIERLWEAGTKLGFWYLKNHGIDVEVHNMFEMGKNTMYLTHELAPYEQGDNGNSFGYKSIGTWSTGETGQRDTIEFLNVAADDAIAWPNRARRSYPPLVDVQMEPNIIPFVRKSMNVSDTILDILSDRLGLPPAFLLKLHTSEEYSSSECRITRVPPTDEESEAKKALGSHTDFGSLTLLHHERIGGLQVLVPGSEDWQYIKPIPGHAICNIGDALSIFSAGLLRSNQHRVVSPPGAQSQFERLSVVYFSRPADSVHLRTLVEESQIIADAVEKNPHARFSESSVTAGEWCARRVKNYRLTNWKGPESWQASRGTESVKDV